MLSSSRVVENGGANGAGGVALRYSPQPKGRVTAKQQDMPHLPNLRGEDDPDETIEISD
jgi:hypothetical protein